MSTDDLEVPLDTGIEAPFAAGMFRALIEDPERERRFKEFALIAFAEALEGMTIGDRVSKWKCGETEHGIMSEEEMREYRWMDNAKLKVADFSNLVMPSFFGLVPPQK